MPVSTPPPANALPNPDREGGAIPVPGISVFNEAVRYRFLNPRLALAMASLVFLAAAGIALRPDQPKPTSTVLAVQQQSVKVDTEGVTITNVYME